MYCNKTTKSKNGIIASVQTSKCYVQNDTSFGGQARATTTLADATSYAEWVKKQLYYI
ncbi:hypothetical protein MTR_7g078005 [Medicago truncatula]|uniref:Uncharacterized protein n=1 Tax=Medicago truncatula TaxID=3880 RepID=A0A072UC17_MEDTR|nr:hypothetical protein MTR_7g078005 [Medicago truncatula]